MDLEEKLHEVVDEVENMSRADYRWEKFKFFLYGLVVLFFSLLLSPILFPMWAYNAIATLGIRHRISVKLERVRRKSPEAAAALEELFNQ